jgi:hypothetical protein
MSDLDYTYFGRTSNGRLNLLVELDALLLELLLPSEPLSLHFLLVLFCQLLLILLLVSCLVVIRLGDGSLDLLVIQHPFLAYAAQLGSTHNETQSTDLLRELKQFLLDIN